MVITQAREGCTDPDEEEHGYELWPTTSYRERRESNYQPDYLDFVEDFHFGHSSSDIWHNGIEGIFEYQDDEAAIKAFKVFVRLR